MTFEPVAIVRRLRQLALPDPHDEREVLHGQLYQAAADVIEQQAKEIESLRAELQRRNNLDALNKRIDSYFA